MEKNILGLHKFNGGIEELSLKISQIRTWTYISNHPNWIDNENYWQEKTQDIENNLSDKLHEGLVNRFVDSTSKYFINSQNNQLNPDLLNNNGKFLRITSLCFIISLEVKGNNISQTRDHLKNTSDIGGMSSTKAALPTIKLPAQNNVARTNIV